MKFKPIMALLGWLVAGKLSWTFWLFLETSITYKIVSPSVKIIKTISPFFVHSTLFITSHFVEYIVGALVIATLSWFFKPDLDRVLLFVLGATYKPVIMNATMILSYTTAAEAMSVWTRTVLFQDMVSSLIILPAILIATALLIKRKKEKAQHSARPVG
jgi:hypothetical protein